MIGIINQHKGNWDELRTHLKSYEDHCKSTQFHMVLVVDQTDVPNDIKNYKAIGLTILFNEKNIGLSPSRAKAAQYLHAEYGDQLRTIIFGFTNGEFINDLNDDLEHELSTESILGHCILIPCLYDKGNPFDKHIVNFKESAISFSDYFNNEDRPDYQLAIPGDCYKFIMFNPDEKYYPEELILWNSMILHNHRHFKIFHYVLCSAYYNKNGLSMNFNRQFMVDNKAGFALRAKTFLTEFKLGNLPLTGNRLKNLMYDYVTLSDNLDKELIQKDTILDTIYQWSLLKWLHNPDHNHQIKFIEDVKQTD